MTLVIGLSTAVITFLLPLFALWIDHRQAGDILKAMRTENEVNGQYWTTSIDVCPEAAGTLWKKSVRDDV